MKNGQRLKDMEKGESHRNPSLTAGCNGAGGMSQQLRALCAFPENRIWVPRHPCQGSPQHLCPSLLLIAVIKITTRNNLGRRRLI